MAVSKSVTTAKNNLKALRKELLSYESQKSKLEAKLTKSVNSLEKKHEKSMNTLDKWSEAASKKIDKIIEKYPELA